MASLTTLPTELLLNIFELIIAGSAISCPKQPPDLYFKRKFSDKRLHRTEAQECACMPQGPSTPVDLIAVTSTCRTLRRVYDDNGGHLEILCARRLMIGKLEWAKALVMVEEFRDEHERNSGSEGLASAEAFEELRERIETAPYTRDMARKMIRAEHYLREILLLTNCEEYKLIHAPGVYVPTYKGFSPANVMLLTEAIIGRWGVMRKDDKVEQFLAWIRQKYFPAVNSKNASITETLLFDFWQIDKEHEVIKRKGYTDCYQQWGDDREELQEELTLEFKTEDDPSGFKAFTCNARLDELVRKVRLGLWAMHPDSHFCGCCSGYRPPEYRFKYEGYVYPESYDPLEEEYSEYEGSNGSEEEIALEHT